jgi:hypothetical protein
VGDVEEDGLIRLPPKIESKCRRAYELFGALGCPDCGTELTRRSKKPEPHSAADTKILPTELQIGDRITDGTGEWEVIRPPYSTAGERIVHARVQRIGEPDSWEIRNWDASKRISVVRASPEEGKG